MTTSHDDNFNFGVTRSWLDDQKIALIGTQGNMSQEAVDEWVRVVEDTFENWPGPGPVMILHDLSHPNQGVSNYALHCTRDLHRRLRPSMTAYHAAVLANIFIVRMVDVLVMQMQRLNGYHKMRLFDKQDEALAWLRQQHNNEG